MSSHYKKTIVHIDSWQRKETYQFFRGFVMPYFNIHTEIDVTLLFQYCKRNNLSLFMGYHHMSGYAARRVENFLFRIEGEQVVKYEGVDLSTTIINKADNLAFTHFPYKESLEEFCENSKPLLEKYRNSGKLFNGHNGPDVLHCTTLPWFKFKGIQHAFTEHDVNGIPKFAYGKFEVENNRVIMPISIGLHHALGDGYHVGLFLDEMKKYMEKLASSGTVA
jgi:chloramphenicol O-acetyltransferase type A